MLRSLIPLPLISRHGAGIRGENLVAVNFRVLGQWFFHYLSHIPQNMPKGLLNTLVLPFLFPREHLPPPIFSMCDWAINERQNPVLGEIGLTVIQISLPSQASRPWLTRVPHLFMYIKICVHTRNRKIPAYWCE